VPELHGCFEIGKAKVLVPGGDYTIVSTGILTVEALLAREILAARGISAGVIHMPTVKPIDSEVLLLAARYSKGFVTAEEHSIIGGLGEAVCAVLAEHLPRPVRRIGMRDVFGESGHGQELLDRYGLRAPNIAEELIRLCGQS
jgi:transketolase